jgi:hypothetical protein
MFKNSQLEPQIIREWLKRPRVERTEAHVRPFFNNLADFHPALLDFGTAGEKYLRVHAILRHHIERH